MTFEHLVHSEKFVAELLTKTIGQLSLPRPKAVRRVSCGNSVANTSKALQDAHLKATLTDEATMITGLGVPYLHLEHESATAVVPDFAIVCARRLDSKVVGSWLIMGDAKDYERVRSRIDDGRMLKGFLQVALGAESAAAWSALPPGMEVHRSGALAVPRNAFLQPEAVVEVLDDHRAEVRVRAEERLAAKADLGEDRPTEAELATYVAHLESTFDPNSCASCNMYTYCRSELRASPDPIHLLTEIGISPLARPALVYVVDGSTAAGVAVPESLIAQVTATVTGLPRWNGRLRVDPAGLPGTINVVLVKADSAALGLHGIAVQRLSVGGPRPWSRRTFIEPQSPLTRRSAMRLLGAAIREVLEEGLGPVHLVVPDRPTADLLATAADSLAGVELSRLRWQHDLDSGRPALTFDGANATMPQPLSDDERLAVSFLLEEDRARAMDLRNPIVDLRSILANHLVAGGPASDAGRLDYLVRWAATTSPLDHRRVSDEIAGQDETPGAKLSNAGSDLIFKELKTAAGDPAAYVSLVSAALDYRITTLGDAIGVLANLRDSRLRPVFQTLESDAQVVWARRLALQASDLVRFSRTYQNWRNAQVDMMDADRRCATQLAVLADTSLARENAADAGIRELALATVLSLSPLRLEVKSRRLVDGSRVVALHVNDRALLEASTTTLKIQTGSFKFGQLPVGFLRSDEFEPGLRWQSLLPIVLNVGDELVLADTEWFGTAFKSGHEVSVVRPALDKKSAPTATCLPGSYAADPQDHQWCCKPHLIAEAEWADKLAVRRARGELNPETWPPLVDEERFDVGPNDGAPNLPTVPAPAGLTIDDLD